MANIVPKKGVQGRVVSEFEGRLGDVLVAIMATLVSPVIIIAFAGIGIAGIGFIAFALVHWALEPMGLVQAWYAMASSHAAELLAPAPFIEIFLKNMIWAAAIGALLSLPGVKRALSTMGLYKKSPGFADSISIARNSGIAGFALHVLLSGAIAAGLAAVGVELPSPGSQIVSAVAASFGGGGWPPAAEEAGMAIIVIWTVLVTAGVVIGAMFGGVIMGIGGMAVRGAAGGAASGAGKAVGKALVRALSKNDYSADPRLVECMMSGAARGAGTGAVYAFVLFAGAALMGWGG